MTATTAHPSPLSGRLGTTASLTTYGHLSWVVWFWVGGALLTVLIAVAVTIDGEVDQSVWQSINTALSWVVFAAGVTTVPAYIAIFLSNGATRSELSRASAVSLAVLAVLGGVVAAVGFVVERVVFGVLDWSYTLPDGRGLDQAGTIATEALAHAAGLTCYFASGWLVGVAYRRLPLALFLLSIVPALIPIAVADLLLFAHDGFTGSAGPPSLFVGVPVALVLAAVASLIAARATREVTVDP